MRTRRIRVLAPWAYTLGSVFGALVIIGLIVFALYDSVTSAKTSEQQFRANTLAAELSNFLLATREPDGSSLLENPQDFSRAERPLTLVQLRRPFYSYLLNRQNARQLTADKIAWEAPRPCITEYGQRASSSGSLVAVQACFAVLPAESTGRFIYFSVRYPVEGLRRHTAGDSLIGQDRLILRFSSGRVPPVVLVYRTPTLAMERYPSQVARFNGIHEMAAFLANSPERPLRHFNAQAFERRGEGDDTRNYVTIVGRIEGAFLDPQSDLSAVWPSPAVQAMSIGIETFRRNADGSEDRTVIAPGTNGRALVSLQNAYLATVPSRSLLIISRARGANSETVWSSSSLALATPPRRTDWRQRVSDWWAPKLLAMARYQADPPYELPFRLPAPTGELKASLTAPPITLPGFATRAFGWLTAALLVAVILSALGAYAVYRLRSLTRLAWAMTSGNINPTVFKARPMERDEFSTLWRVLRLFYRRNQTNLSTHIRHVQRETAEKAKEVRMLQARLELRQERLAAIGHEIRSPLASLLVRTEGDAALQSYLHRIHNAIEAMLEAATVEDGIQNQKIICGPVDLADYLRRLVENSRSKFENLAYVGPQAPVVCLIDDLYFETVLSHLLSNAVRYRFDNSQITIRLSRSDDSGDAIVEVCNVGPQIPQENLKSIFLYKTSDSKEPQNKGIGLFAAKSYLIGMKATIAAENRQDGVAFVITVPLMATA